MDRFNTPAFADDLSDEMADGWSAVIDRWIRDKVVRLENENPGSEVAFFNELQDPVPDGQAAEKQIIWDGFPLVLKKRFANIDNARIAAETPQSITNLRRQRGQNWVLFVIDQGQAQIVDFFYRNQDEYLEWFVERDAANDKIQKVTFTCEGPEYWRFIAGGTNALNFDTAPSVVVDGDEAKLLQLYNDLVGPQVQLEDLLHPLDVHVFDLDSQSDIGVIFPAGTYNEFNRFNTTDGLVHLIQPNNTLSAEINLAGDGTVLRKDANSDPVMDSTKLICCSGYAAVNRSSDPSIGSEVNSLVRQGLKVTLRDPVGLYIKDINLDAFSGPNGEDCSECWNVLRGQDGLILRAEFRVPDSLGFTLEEIEVEGEPLRSGAQIAEQVSMVLFGKAHNFGSNQPQLLPCVAHCCTLQENPQILRVTGTGRACQVFNTDEQTWEESFPELVEADSSMLGGVTTSKLSTNRVSSDLPSRMES